MDKIQTGQLVEMKELLQDNISLLAQLEEVQGLHSLQMVGATHPRLREVSKKLVDKIQMGQLAEMKELLQDNILLLV